jgi:hypothetical protein
MAKYEDYIVEEIIIEDEIVDAGAQQEDREESTLEINWEKRYTDMEVAFSQQGQQMGDYRKLIDDFISTPATESATDSTEVSPITPDDIYENPDEAIRRVVDSHPTVQRVKDLEADLLQRSRAADLAEFRLRHPSFGETGQVPPDFGDWVMKSPMRVELARRADEFDMTAADALFSLYESEHPTTPNEAEAAVLDAAGLESSTGTELPEPERYSRSQMLAQKIRAKQGDIEAIQYVKSHAEAYRHALIQGTVRD